jgi:predicted YcjX-like family ATPase
LSIKLKYGSFEKFYERKNVETINFKPFQDDYFAEFERQTIQVDQIAE